MTTTAATLVINVIAKTKDAISGVESATGRLGKFQSGLQKAAVPAAIAGAAVIKFGSDAVESASRLEQAMGGVESVFGRNADVVDRWGNKSAESVGLAKSEYSELAAVIGSQLKGAGIPMDQVAGKTNNLIKMGADLAATYGGTTADAVEALSSALKGETDPIERYGVSLKQADVNAAVFASGLSKLHGPAAKTAQRLGELVENGTQAAEKIKKLDEADKPIPQRLEATAKAGEKAQAKLTTMQGAVDKTAKAQATLGLITKATTDAHGAFARESDTAAHAQQVAAAQWEDAKAALGEGLLPAVTAVTTKLGAMAKWLGEHKTVTLALVGVVGALSAAIFILIAALKAYEITMRIVRAVQEATWLSALGPIALVIAAVVAIVAIFVILYKKVGWFRDFVDATWAAIKRATIVVASAVKSAFLTAMRAIGPAVKVVVAIFKTVWRVAFTVVKTYLAVWMAAFRLVFGVIKGAVKLVVAIFKGDWRGALDAVKSILGAFGGFFRDLWHALESPIRALAGLLRSIMNGAISAVRGFIDRARKAASDTATAILNAIGGFVGDMLSAGEDLIQGLIDGMGNMVQAAVDKVKGIGESVIGAVKGVFGSHSPSKVFAVIGKDVVRGFIIGVTSSDSAAARAFDRLGSIIKAHLEGKAERAELAFLHRSQLRWNSWLRARKSIADKVAAADATVRAKTQELADYARDVADSARDYASAVGATFDEGVIPTASDFIANMRERADALKTYAANIKALAARGLNATTLRQLIDAGVEGGSAMASALVAGGQGAIKATNDLQGDIGRSAKALGDFAGNKFYSAGVKTAQGIANGLHSQQDRLLKHMKDLAQRMAKTLTTELNKAFKAHPITSTASSGGHSVAGLAVAPSVLGASPTAATSGGGVTINVNGALDPEAVARQIRRILDGHDRRIGLRVA